MSVSKTEQSIIKLKKTLDYTESTIPIQFQFQYTINGKPQTPNIFTIPELQNVVEKDNNIDFVDIFGLKGKNVSYIPPENRNLIVIIVQSLMGFNPQISLDPRVNAKLNNCLNRLKNEITVFYFSVILFYFSITNNVSNSCLDESDH